MYLGDWVWAAVNANNSNDKVIGLTSFNTEAANTSGAYRGQLVAGGVYTLSDAPTTPAGLAIMGPIASPLDVGFTDLTAKNVFLVGVDTDGRLAPLQDSTSELNGHATFSGVGRVYDTNGNYISVGIALIQVNSAPSLQPSAQAVSPSLLSNSIGAQKLGVQATKGQSLSALALAAANRFAASGQNGVRSQGTGPLSRILQGK